MKPSSMTHDLVVTPLQVYLKVKYILKYFKVLIKPKLSQHFFVLDIDESMEWGFFYGASQGNLGLFVVGGIIFKSTTHSFSFSWSLGRGSNNWEKLSTLET